MIPYLLAVAGGYLIGNSLKSEKFTDGGMTDSKISDFKKRIKERYGKDGMYAENFSPEPTSKEIDKAVRMFLDWTDSKQKKFNPKDTENVEIVGDIMLYNRGEAFYNLGYEKIVKEILKSVKPQTSKMADGGETHGGMMAKGGKTKKKGDVGKSGTQYGYTLKEYEEMGEKMGLFVSPKNWWKSQEGKKYEDSFGRTQTIGRHSGDEEQEMMRYGYRIAIGMDLGSDKIPASARKYVIDNNLEK